MTNEATKTWIPPSTFEEKLKHTVIPPGFFIRRIARKAWRKGEKELRLVPFLVDRSRNALDIGACWGVYSFYMAQYCPKVYAFEPNPKVFKVLERNIASNVEVFPYALSNKTTDAVLRVPTGKRGYSNQGASLSEQKVDGKHGKVDVVAKRLDDLDINNIGFMKIDVEGFEQEVIEGGLETIKANRPTLLVEMEEIHTKMPIEESVRNIESIGYKALVLVRNQLTSFDHFDAEKNHRQPASREDYVFNFIFLPSKS